MSKIFYRHIRPTVKWANVKATAIILNVPIEATELPNPKFYYDMTLAAKVSGEDVHIGVGVCAHNDNFTRSKGREYAEERLTYDPTYTFKKYPGLSDEMNTTWWMNAIANMIIRNGQVVKDLVSQKQAAFDLTETGIRLKMNRRRHEAELIEAKEKAEKEARDSYAEVRAKAKKKHA